MIIISFRLHAIVCEIGVTERDECKQTNYFVAFVELCPRPNRLAAYSLAGGVTPPTTSPSSISPAHCNSCVCPLCCHKRSHYHCFNKCLRLFLVSVMSRDLRHFTCNSYHDYVATTFIEAFFKECIEADASYSLVTLILGNNRIELCMCCTLCTYSVVINYFT